MQVLDWGLNGFGVFGGFFALLLGLLEVVERSLRKRLFGALLIAVGVLQLSLCLDTSGIRSTGFVQVPAILLIGPLAYGSVLALTDEDFRLRPEMFLWLLPAQAGLMLIFLPGLSLLLWICAAASTVFFCVLLWLILRSVTELRTRILIGIFLLDFAGIGMLLLAAVFINEVFYKFAQTGISLVMCLLYFVRVRYPETSATIEAQVSQAKYAKSRLKGLDRRLLLERLVNLMSSELYSRDDLTLASVARQMDLTPHQLSELINCEFQTGFFSFVNSFRVKAARDLLSATEKSVLEIAFEVGFNNKSSFNEAFQKFVGQTPVQYRKDSRTEASVIRNRQAL